MPFGFRRFKIGGVEYPLTADTTNTLLQDGDPALYYALDLFETMLDEYIGERLLAQAALLGYNFPSAVARAIHYEPSPFLQAHDMAFPLFALYRSEEAWDRHTVSFEKATSIWSWAYVLPPLEPVAIERLSPIIQNVAKVISIAAMQSFDPNWQQNQTLRDLSGIQSMKAGPVRYLDIEMLDGDQNRWWRAVSGKLIVEERTSIVLEALDEFEGANVSVDLDPGDDTKIEDFVVVNSFSPAVLEQVLPNAGTKAGGAYFEIIGQGFRPGTPGKVLIGGSYASSVYVASPTKVTGLTPAHSAQPTFAADVQFIDADGVASNILSGAYTFLTP